jgi:hypothetical protein
MLNQISAKIRNIRVLSLVVAVTLAVAVPAPDSIAAGPTTRVLTFQYPKGARVSFVLDGMNTAATAHQQANTIEVRIDGDSEVSLASLKPLREVTGIDVRKDGKGSIATVHLAYDCEMKLQRIDRTLRVDLVDRGQPPAVAASAPSPDAAPVAPPVAAPAKVPAPAAAPAPPKSTTPAPASANVPASALAVVAALGPAPVKDAPSTPTPAPAPAPAPAKGPAPAPAASAVAAAPANVPTTRVLSFQYPQGARVSFVVGYAGSNVTARQQSNAIEVHIDDKSEVSLAALKPLREVTGIDVRKEGKGSIATIHLASDCEVKLEKIDLGFRVDLVDRGPPPAVAATAAAAPVKGAAPVPAAAPAKAPVPAPAATPAKGTAVAKASVPAKGKADGSVPAIDLDALRNSLTEKLALLQNPPKQQAADTAQQPAANGSAADPAQPDQGARPACPPTFSMEGWKGQEAFADRLRLLRMVMARSGDAPEAIAALAEFYLGNGLAAEARALLDPVKRSGVDPEKLKRLDRDNDIARLLKGEPIRSESTLLAESENCDRTDIPLWRVLSAAASGDEAAVHRDADAASHALLFLPQPLSSRFALRIAAAGQDDKVVLQAMAASLRNTDAGDADELAGRYLLQAWIARTQNDPVTEESFLVRAAPSVGAIGLQAKVRLAELHAAQSDDVGRQSMLTLADAARVYRDTKIGQSATTVLSDLLLSRGDYTGALKVAVDSTANLTAQRNDSYGAALAVKVLHKLLVETDAQNLPPPDQRLYLFWKYGGYATPGEKGDDIRAAAAQLMIAQGLPEAALKVTRQLSDTIGQSDQGIMLRAAAEASAGDADQALSMLKGRAPTPETQRISAVALKRLGHPLDAAHQLDGLKDVDREIERAALFYEARDWGDASDAYAEVLRKDGLSQDQRGEAGDRYALALALAGKPPAADLRQFSGLAQRVIEALPSNNAGGDKPSPVSEVRDSIRRAIQIEGILPPADHPPAPPTTTGG